MEKANAKQRLDAKVDLANKPSAKVPTFPQANYQSPSAIHSLIIGVSVSGNGSINNAQLERVNLCSRIDAIHLDQQSNNDFCLHPLFAS
jgi:hypothetical protein